MGPEIVPELAKVVGKMLTARLLEDRIKKLLDSNKRPANIHLLTNPHVNAHIWAKLKENMRREDNKLTKVGERLARYLVMSTIIVERLAKLKDQVLGDTRRQIKDIAKLALDAIQFGALTMQELNQRRRSNVKHDFNPT